MTYTEFKNTLLISPLVLSKDLCRLGNHPQAVRNQLNRWQAKKLIIKLKRGVYLLNENDRKINPSRTFIANELYSPSYISLEYALSYYGLIPEKVVDVTSVTTKKTMLIKNGLGNFVYQHVKPQAFRGFKLAKDSAGLNIFMAEPEKAVVDFLYLNLSKISAPDLDIFAESFRFQNTGSLSKRKLMNYAELFKNRKLYLVTAGFCELVKKEAKR